MKFVQSRNESYSYFTFNDLKTIAVNKKVRCLYYKNKKTIEIQPQTFQYELHSLNKWVIRIDSIVIEIPLVWKEFTFFYGDLRMKFLFKKNRYQISIKGSKAIKDLRINDEKVGLDTAGYLKKYYETPKLTAHHNTYFYDCHGRTLQKSSVSDPFILNIIAQNKYGHIHPNIHVRKLKSRKNIHLNPPGSDLNLLSAHAEYEVIIPKTAIIKLETEYKDSYLNRILLSRASVLQEKLCIFLEENNQAELLMKAFRAVFGFQPLIQPLSKINQIFNTDNIIISQKSPGEEKIRLPLYSEILVKKGGQKRALLFSQQNFLKWLKTRSLH